MRDFIDRQIFILKNQANIAYSNFLVNRAFNPSAIQGQKKLAYAAAALSVLLLVGVSFGSILTKQNFSPDIPSVASISLPPVIDNLPTISEPDIASLTEIPEPAIPALPEMPPNYVLVVNKATQSLFILKETRDDYEIVRSFDISLGKIIGAKEKEGDLRTPEGFYKILEIKNDAELPAIYGPRAFVLDYPNEFDMANGRSGGGIWLHGSGLGKKTPDTKGCVELDDMNIIALGEWAKIGTQIAIFPTNFSLPISDGRVEKRFLSSEFFYGDFIGQDRLAARQ